MNRRTADRLIVTASGAVIVALTAAAFWLSYAHLAEIATAHGLTGARAWAWPGCLDAFVIAGELLMLRAALQGRTDWWAITLTVTGSGGSILLNVVGVGGGATPLDYVVAGVPPTAALLAFGVLMRQVHRWLADTTLPAAASGGGRAVVICDGGGLGIPAVPKKRQPTTRPKPKQPRKPATGKNGKGKASGRRTDAEVLAEARGLTASWTLDELTADRLMAELHIGPVRARMVRETLRAERAHQAAPEPQPEPEPVEVAA